MHPEALILRRCYPVPVTFADLRAAAKSIGMLPWPSTRHMERIAGNVYRPLAKYGRARWTVALEQVTGALDEVYAVVDGREVRVAVVMDAPLGGVGGRDEYATGGPEWRTSKRDVRNLLEVADEQGYWERPHEVRFGLSPRPVSHGEVARAMLVGQKYVERKVSPMGGKTYFAEYTLQHGQRSVDIMRTADVLPVIMVDALERDAVK